MPAQDGLRFLFDLDDKITAKLAKIEAKSKASAAKIDKAFTRASRSQETNSARAIASEQRRIAAVEKAHAKSVALLKRQSEAFKRSMTRMASAATVAFAVVAGKALDMAGGYDAAMRSVQAKTGATGEVLDKLSAQAREMGRTTVHSATEAARGQAFLAQAGFDVDQIFESLPHTLALATAGELDLSSAANIASGVMKGFRLETAQMGRVVDVLALGAASSNTSVEQLGAAMAKAAPGAAAAGWSMEETAAAIGKLSDAMIQGEEAGTTLKVMMAKLAISGGPTEKKLKELGITVKDTTTGAMLPLNDILTALAPHADDVGLQFELLGTRGGNAGLILGAMAQDARKLTGELENASGSSQRMADIMGGGLWGSLKAIGSLVDSAYISFGERLAPALQKAVDLFRKLPAPIQEVTVIVGSLVGAMGVMMVAMPASFGALVTFPGKLIALAKSIKLVKVATIAMSVAQKAAAAAQWLVNAAMSANPIGLVIAAIALLVVAWIKWDDEIKAFLRGTWDLVKKGFYAFKRWVTEAFGVLQGWLDKIPTPILALMGPVGLVLAVFRKWDDIKEIAKGAHEGIKKWLFDKPKSLYRKIDRAVEKVTRFFGDMKDDIERFVRKAYEGIEKWLVDKLGAASTKVRAKVEAVTGFFGDMKNKIVGSGKAAYEGIKLWLSGKIGAISTTIKGKVDAVTGFFSDMKGKVVGYGKAAYEGIKLWLSDKIGAVSATIKAKVDAVIGFFDTMKVKVVGYGKAAYEGITLWLSDKIGAISSAIQAKVDIVIGFFSDMKGAIVGYAKAAYEGITLWMSTKLGEASATIKSKVDSVSGFFGDMKDKIVGAGKATYEGIKLWMSDKLGAIFGSIKEKIDAVTGFFGDMKDKIVGNSIVPDMVNLVGGEFGRMGTIMTEKTATATADVVENLGDLTEKSIDAASAGNKLNEAQIEIVESTQDATERASGYGLALAGMAGQMGGATGQMTNLVIAMREHNKTQKAAAALGKKTEGSFGKMRMGAAGLATAFSAVGEMVGGVAGKVLTEISGIAKAFATGGLVAGIIAGVMALGKAIWGLFSRGKKKRAAEAKKEAAAAKIVADAAKAAADTHAEAVEGLRLAWLNLPTEQIVLDLTAIRDAWDALGVEDRTSAFDDYVQGLISARDAGAELTAAELNLITVFEEHQGKRTAMLARHKAEMSGFDTQIAALESLLGTNISEVDALIAQQEAAMEALSARQDAEMAALATRRQAALDSIMSVQNEQLALLKETQSKELAEMQAAQEAELSMLKAARNAQLSVIESAIQRELEDERIAAQLKIDLYKAGGDQEAIHAAKLRAQKGYDRLKERDQLSELMAEAEVRVRARHQDELDMLNEYWDAKEATTVVRYQDEQMALEEKHAGQMTELEAAHALELETHNTYWDDLEELMALRHGVELENLEAAHTAQLVALLASLVERRDALKTSHATELKDLDDFHDAKIKAILAAQAAERDARRPTPTPTTPPPVYPDPAGGGYPGGAPPDYGHRQHGGPVSAGQRYRVGEGGPEMFIPSERGRIEPHGSSGGGVDAKALGRAVADALEGTEIKVDGRKLGRLTIRHQPLAIAELGGQR